MFPLLVLVAGLTGTFMMTMVMLLIHHKGWANADMIRAIGSLVTRRYENSVIPGLLLHTGAGIVFAVPYLLVMRGAGISHPIHIISIGLAMGTFHGAAMIFILMALAEKHPVPQFQKANIDVAWAHVVGHVAYGAGVGLVAAFLGAKFGFFPAS